MAKIRIVVTDITRSLNPFEKSKSNEVQLLMLECEVKNTQHFIDALFAELALGYEYGREKDG